MVLVPIFPRNGCRCYGDNNGQNDLFRDREYILGEGVSNEVLRSEGAKLDLKPHSQGEFPSTFGSFRGNQGSAVEAQGP